MNKPAPKISLPQDRTFGVFFSSILLTIFAWQAFLNQRFLWILLIASLALTTAALFIPQCLRPLNLGWYYIGKFIHKLTNPLIMGFIFFGVITPIALLKRLGSSSSFPKGFDPQQQTYWITRTPPGPESDTLSHQF